VVLEKEGHVAGVLHHSQNDSDLVVVWRTQVGILGSLRGVVHCRHHIQDDHRMQVVGVETWTPPTWIRSLGEP
jgi:hypothetical protein